MNLSHALYGLISGSNRDELEFPWSYYRLADISLIGAPYPTWARITCEDDEGGQMFTVRCPGPLFPELEPYASELLAWRDDPSAMDQPVIPILFPEEGRSCFYPQAECPESHECLTEMPPELLVQIQNASSGLHSSTLPSFLNRFLRSASDFG